MADLRELDLEVAVLWDQPACPAQFWRWLTRDVVGQLRGLEKFVMKVSVYRQSALVKRMRSVDDWIPTTAPLTSYTQEDYVALQQAVTRGGPKCAQPG